MMPAVNDYLSVLAQEWTDLQRAVAGDFASTLETVVVYTYAMSLLWTVTSLVYWLKLRLSRPPALRAADVPRYSVLIPFHGEPVAALSSARSLELVTPQPDEIILIDDGCKVPMPEGTVLPPRTVLIRLPQRRGKAGALNAALSRVRSEIVVCLDADTQALSRDWSAMLSGFGDKELGAVTGCIWPTRYAGLIGVFQRIDYLAVISVIKAAETIWGGLLTVSGAFVAYRKSAVVACGGWREDKAAEDIDISWRMQCEGWRFVFDNRWTCGVEMAPTLKALWLQRRRWSAGLGQALRDYGARAVAGGARHLHSVIISLANLTWLVSLLCFTMLTIAEILTGGKIPVSADASVATVFGLGFLLFAAQFMSAALIDGRPFATHLGLVPFVPLYAIYFWSVLVTSFLFGFPKGLFRKRLGVWQPTVRQQAISNGDTSA